MPAFELALPMQDGAAPRPIGVIALDKSNNAYVARVLLDGADSGLAQLVKEINGAPLALPDPTIGTPNLPMTGIMTFEKYEPEYAEALQLWLEFKGFHVTPAMEPT